MSVDPEPVPAEPKPNAFQRMAGVIVTPAETFSSIARRPDWVIPLIVIVILSVITGVVVVKHLDFDATIRAQMAEKGLKGEQIERGVELAKKVGEVTPYFSVIMVPATFLIFAGLLLLAFNLLGGEGRFSQFFSMVIYSWIPQMIKGILMTALIATKGMVTQTEVVAVLKSNLGAFVDPDKNKMMFAVLSSFDLFNIWTIVLLAIGLAIAARTSRAKSAAIVVGLYCLIILGKVGIAAMQSMGARG